MESPLCTPARSICSMMPGISTVSPSPMASTSHLFALQVLIDEHRMAGIQFHSQLHVAHQFGGVVHDLHRPAAQHVAGAHQHRVADKSGHVQGFVQRRDPGAGRLGMPSSDRKSSKRRRSSARSMVSALEPMMGIPVRVSGSARLMAVCPPNWHDGGRTGAMHPGVLVLQNVPHALFIQRLRNTAGRRYRNRWRPFPGWS